MLSTGCLLALSVLTWNGQELEATMPSCSEVLHLHVRVVPVALHQRMLLAQQVERGVVLGLGELVGVLDAEIRLFAIR